MRRFSSHCHTINWTFERFCLGDPGSNFDTNGTSSRSWDSSFASSHSRCPATHSRWHLIHVVFVQYTLWTMLTVRVSFLVWLLTESSRALLLPGTAAPRSEETLLAARTFFSVHACPTALVISPTLAQDELPLKTFFMWAFSKNNSHPHAMSLLLDFLFQVSYLDPFSDLTKLVYDDADWGWLKTILDTRSVGLSLEG